MKVKTIYIIGTEKSQITSELSLIIGVMWHCGHTAATNVFNLCPLRALQSFPQDILSFSVHNDLMCNHLLLSCTWTQLGLDVHNIHLLCFRPTAALTFGFSGVQSSLSWLESATGQEVSWSPTEILEKTTELLSVLWTQTTTNNLRGSAENTDSVLYDFL